jgi:hypothetical protein
MNALSLSTLKISGIAAIATLGLAAAALPQALTQGQPISFSMEVQPILEHACVECHQPGGEGYKASGLDLRTYASLMKGTKHGPMVIPGDPLTSNLLVLIEGRASPSIRMPYHMHPLRKEYDSIIRQWIIEGAKDN